VGTVEIKGIRKKTVLRKREKTVKKVAVTKQITPRKEQKGRSRTQYHLFLLQEKGHPAFMCPDKDKETGMMAFNFNVEKHEEEELCDVLWYEEATNQPEWTKIDASSACSQYLIVENDERANSKEVERSYNQNDALYESDDKISLVDSKGTFGDNDEYDDEDMVFIIPSCYSFGQESTFNVEVNKKNKQEVYANKYQNKSGWKEEWLLDSGSTVNLTNRKERFWDQRATKTTVTVGDGSEVVGLCDGNIILKKEKNMQENLKITATYCPNFRKNILSVSGCNWQDSLWRSTTKSHGLRQENRKDGFRL
jgi:hypothetical protein